MAESLREIGEKIICTVGVFILGTMVAATRGNMNSTRSTDTGSTPGQIKENMKGFGNLESSME